jgi:hypothetical protein
LRHPLPLKRCLLCSQCPAQLRNEADTAIYSTEKSLNEYKAKLPQVRLLGAGQCQERVEGARLCLCHQESVCSPVELHRHFVFELTASTIDRLLSVV